MVSISLSYLRYLGTFVSSANKSQIAPASLMWKERPRWQAHGSILRKEGAAHLTLTPGDSGCRQWDMRVEEIS